MKLLELYSMGVPIFMPAPGFEVDLEEASVNLGMFLSFGKSWEIKKGRKIPLVPWFCFSQKQTLPKSQSRTGMFDSISCGMHSRMNRPFSFTMGNPVRLPTVWYSIHPEALLLQMSRIIFVASWDFFLGSKLLTPRMGWMNVFYDVYVFYVFLLSILGFDMVWYTKLAGHVCFLPSKRDISSQGRFLHVVLQLDHRGPGGHGVLPIPQWCSSTVLCHAGTTTPTS